MIVFQLYKPYKHKNYIFYFKFILSKYANSYKKIKFPRTADLPLGNNHTVHTSIYSYKKHEASSCQVSFFSKGEIKIEWKKQSPNTGFMQPINNHICIQ